jgi:hypothetical protein
MTLVILVLVVLAQITLFQVLAVLANRSIVLEETSRLTYSIPRSVTDHARKAPVVRMGIGFFFACVVLLAAFGPIDDRLTAQMLIVGVSVGSAVVFAVSQERDRRVMRDLADADPDGGLRRASLERRGRGWYHPAMEALPLLVFVATAVFLLNVGFVSGSVFTGDRTRVLVYFGLQGAVVAWGLYRGLRPEAGVASIASYIPSLRRNPEVSMRLGDQLEGTQLRFFLLVKIGISAMLGAMVVKNVLRATGNAAAASWGVLGWCIVAALVVVYAFYFRRVGQITRQMQDQTG